jgi:hypothetical protein
MSTDDRTTSDREIRLFCEAENRPAAGQGTQQALTVLPTLVLVADMAGNHRRRARAARRAFLDGVSMTLNEVADALGVARF